MSLLVIVVPSPSVLFVIGRTLAHGRRTAVATAVGNVFGSYLLVVAVVIGTAPGSPSPMDRRLSTIGGAGGSATTGLGLTVAVTGRAD
ncbi:hypothetical protein AB0N07_35920 [Streptomyces sp. NPDC051172]|uniref:hypothetical protein n=1 Tax=Streptomyces sp. NPDC051172 TaxID=3155796 RepID=UPI0034373CAA